MKKIIFFIVCFLFAIFNPLAEEFETMIGGDKIANMYIRKVDSNGNITNKQGRFILRSSDNTFVYCLEPFIGLITNYEYKSIDKNYWEYLNISKEVWEEISLIAYYGYKYENHQEDYWYYITQVLIWQEVDKNARFYFLDSLDGDINNNLYIDEINEIKDLVSKHKQKLNISNQEILYGNSLEIYDELLNNYKIINDYDIVKLDNNKLKINANKIGEYKIELYKENNYYGKVPIVYIDEVSQKVLSIGDINADYYSFNIKVTSGNIKITKKDYETKETLKITGIKFLLYDEFNNLIKEESTNADGVVNFSDLKVGNYYIKESSDNYIPGYEINSEIIEVNIDSKETKSIDFYNKKSKGKIYITKYLEVYDRLLKEIPGKNIEFALYDSNNNLIEVKKTNINGEITFDNLDIGKYIIKELSTDYNYVISDPIEVEIKLIDNKASTNNLTITNKLKKGNIVINKYNEMNETLVDVEFKIYNDNFLVIKKTDELGKIEINDIPIGKYFIQETKASNGYQILKDIIPIELINNEETITINVTNKKISIKIPNTSIKVNKIILYFEKKKVLKK